MSPTCTSKGVGNYQATLGHTAVYDRVYKSGGRGIVGPSGVNGSDWPPESSSHTFANEGYPSIGFGSAELWGNAAHLTRITNARSYLISAFGVIDGPVYFIGGSMGAVGALNWAKANPSLVQGLALVIPVIDIQDIYSNDRGGYAASISTAHGGAPADANNPADNAASFIDIPIAIWYSTDDPIGTPATVTAFGSAVGAEMHSLGAVGHAAAGVDLQQAVDFFNEHA